VTRPWVHFLYLLYCVEAGIFLLLVPWSPVWSHSYFAQIPALRPLLGSGFARGAVSAVGLLHLVVAARDLVAFCRALRDA
jgi:hypothetical protein